MKIFKGLALFNALEASSCPDQWTWNDADSICYPSGDWSTTCNKDGTMTITANIKHFYENVPSDIKSALISGLKNNDGWAAVAGESDQLSKTVSPTYEMSASSDAIIGTYTLAPGDTAAGAALVSIGDIKLTRAVPLDYEVECEWTAKFKVDIEGSVDIGDSDTTYDQGSAVSGSLDVDLSIRGADKTTKKWMLGDTVTIDIDNSLDNGLDVEITIEKCTAYSDSAHGLNAVTITHGTCVASAINAATSGRIVGGDYVDSVSFEAFKYNAVKTTSLDAVAYVSCDLRVCLKDAGTVDADCASAVTANQASASKNTEMDCP